MNEWMKEWMNESMNQSINQSINQSVNQSIKETNEWINKSINQLANEWMKEWMKEWMNEWTNELTNEWIEWIKRHFYFCQIQGNFKFPTWSNVQKKMSHLSKFKDTFENLIVGLLCPLKIFPGRDHEIKLTKCITGTPGYSFLILADESQQDKS